MRTQFPGSGRIRLVARTNSHGNSARYLAFVGCLGSTLSLAVLATAIAGPMPDLTTLAVLASLTLISEHRDRLFGDETSISGSMVALMAAVVAFAGTGALFGALVCGAVAGLYWPHLRERSWSKIIVNAASIGFSSFAACALFAAMQSSDPSVSQTLLISIPAVLTYWFINSAVLTAAMALLDRGDFLSNFSSLIRSETHMIAFAFLGGLCGLIVLEVGIWEGTGALVAVLVAVDVLVIGRPRPSTVRMEHPGLMARLTQVVAVVGAGVAAYLSVEPLGPLAALGAGAISGAGATFVSTTLAFRSRLGGWDAPLAFGVVLADAWLFVIGAALGCVAGFAGPLPAAVVGTVAAACALLGRNLRRRRSEPEPVDDVAALAILELALADRREASTGD